MYDPGLLWSALPLTVLSRAVAIFPLAALANCCRGRADRVSPKMAAVMTLSGARGAVSYALVLAIPPSKPFGGGDGSGGGGAGVIDGRPAIETATLFIILVTTLLR